MLLDDVDEGQAVAGVVETAFLQGLSEALDRRFRAAHVSSTVVVSDNMQIADSRADQSR